MRQQNFFLLIISFSVTLGMILPIPPRYMWGWGPGMSGYCGEMSTQVSINHIQLSYVF